MRDIRRNVLPKFTEICQETPYAGAHLVCYTAVFSVVTQNGCVADWCSPDKHQRGGQKPTETSVSEFCYKSVNLFFEELINIKVILFLIHELFR